MVILILIILLFFKLYIKNISNKHLAMMLVIVFVLYETYFYKEHFHVDTRFLHSQDFLKHKNKQECIYENQEKITKDYKSDSFKSVCYKINDLEQCNRTLNCKYDNELSKCIDVNIDCEKDYKDISRIKCHFLDNEDKCNS